MVELGDDPVAETGHDPIHGHPGDVAPVLQLERQLTVVHLQGDRNQNLVGVEGEIVLAQLKGQILELDVDPHGPLEVVVLDLLGALNERISLVPVEGIASHRVHEAIVSPQFLPSRRPPSRRVQESVLFVRVHGQSILAGQCRVDELQDDVVAKSFDVPVSPDLERVDGGGPASLGHGAVIVLTRRMGFDLRRRPMEDIYLSPVTLPTRVAAAETFISVCDSSIMLRLELVFRGPGIRIAP